MCGASRSERRGNAGQLGRRCPGCFVLPRENRMIWMRCVEDRLALEGALTARVAGINGGASIRDRRTPCRGLWLISRAGVVLRPCLVTAQVGSRLY
jgi:hypothetical protein